ncbi:hypothetical protein [Ureibacillus acetophenoni]
MREFRPYSKRVNPIHINIRDRKEIKTGVRLSIPYMLLLKIGETYKIRLPKNKVKEHEFRVINRVHYDGQNLVNWFGLDLPELNPDVNNTSAYNQIGDRFGMTGYCEVEIIIDRFYELFSEAEDDIFKMYYKLLEDACEIYNYFLDRYSAVVRHRQVSKLTPLDFQKFTAFHIKNNEVVSSVHVAALHHVVFIEKKDGVIIPQSSVTERLQELLQSECDEGNIATFGVSAVRQLFTGNYLTGIVESITQLEAYLHLSYKKAFLERGIDEKQVETLLDSFTLRKFLDSLPLIMNRNEFLRLSEQNDLSLINQAVNIRNKYVHLGRNIDELKKFEQVEKYINAINNFCVDLSNFCGIDNMLDKSKSGW